MKFTCFIVVAVACLSVAAPLSHAQKSPIGEWVSVSTSQGGLGGTRTYDTNGVVSVSFGTMLDFKYKLDDAQRVLDCFPQLQNVTIAGQNLTLTDQKTGKKQELTRVKGSDGKGIVGKWMGDHYTGAKQVMHFTSNMNCYFSVPMMSLVGNFTLNGDTLTVEFPGKGRTEWKWDVADDILTMTKADGTKVEKYKRKK